jgi:NADP-dependent 3-hydroxy acid dehydrogenase YdfG
LDWPSVGVEAGSGFARLASDRYVIDPREPEHYRRLLASVAAEGVALERIVHLWTCDASSGGVATAEDLERAQDLGVFSLLYLVQALAQRKGTLQPVQLHVVSNLSQHVLPDDEAAYQYGSLLGLVRTAPQEFPWMDCRHLDLAEVGAAANAARILGELRAASRDREVAYRKGERWIPRLRRMGFAENVRSAAPFRRGGMYLVSGGLGGIGVEIARHLLSEYEAKLLLVGRTPLAPSDTTYRELEKMPGEVSYVGIDVCDPASLRRAVETAQRRWGCELHGVIHLAGIYHERLLAEETRDSFASVLRPKVLGTWALSQLLEGQPDRLFVSFSSLAGTFGGALVGAYSSANSFLESFAHFQRRTSSMKAHCLEWSTWDEVGMSRGNQMKEVMRGRGYCTIPGAQGLRSMLAALRHEEPQVLVGLDGTNRNVQSYADPIKCRTHKLRAYFTSGDGEAVDIPIKKPALTDRFGTRIECDFERLSELPRTGAGEVDREKLARLRKDGDRAATELVAPRTESERQITSIWQEVLMTPLVGVDSDFFQLGGNSILATQVASRIEEAYRVRLSLRTMLEETTVARLAQALQRHLEQAPGPGTDATEKLLPSDAKKILGKLDQLSDEQVSELLGQTLAHNNSR